MDTNSISQKIDPTVFIIYFRRDTGKYYIKTVDENKENFLIFVLLDTPYVIIPLINCNYSAYTKITIYFQYMIIILEHQSILRKINNI